MPHNEVPPRESLRIDGRGGDPRDAEGVLSVIVCEVFEDNTLVSA
jgi:hypothetical protein